MSQLSKSKRVTIANGFAILAAALLMWVFTTRRADVYKRQPKNWLEAFKQLVPCSY